MRRSAVNLAVASALLGVCSFATAAHARGAAHTDSKKVKGDAEDETKAAQSDASESEGPVDKDKNKDESKEADEKKSDDAEEEPAPKKPADAEADKGAAKPEDDSPVEEKGKTYYFVGLRYRGIVVPQFFENAFASGGRTLYVNGIGPEFAIRRDGFEYNLSAWLAFYSMGNTAFKGSSDPPAAWELINANLNILFLTSDFLWSHSFTPEWALNYGLGIGFGFVFGSLHRVQSYPTAAGQNPDNYSKCAGPNDPLGGAYCDTSNNHYGNYSEPSWANNGSKPILFPWLAVQTGIRFKPSRHIAARLDLGFGTSGFFFGLGGDYGL